MTASSPFERAIEDIQWLAERLNGILGLKPELERLGSLEKVRAELEGSVLQLRKSEKQIVANQAAQVVTETKAQADETLALAEAQAKDLVAAAHTRAEDHFRLVKADADDYAAKMYSEAAVSAARVQGLERIRGDLEKELDELTAKRDELKEHVRGALKQGLAALD